MSLSVADAFIARWQGGEGGQERANYALFLTELCDVIGAPKPEPASASHDGNNYVFERVVARHQGDRESLGRIDLYKKDCFVLEAKQSRWRGQKNEIPGQFDLIGSDVPIAVRGRRGADRAWDVLMLHAKQQAENYARALPTSHGWPPFILVCDVGHCIEVFADFSGQGKNYTQFPDRQSYRIYLEDLRDEKIRARLNGIWTAPHALDPAQASAKATREIAARLAQVSRALELQNFPAHDVAQFLMRCLFTMFAEDVGLLENKAFERVLEDCEKDPAAFPYMVGQLWEAMDRGEWAHAVKARVRKFNGEFFKDRTVLPLAREEIGELRAAARYNWKEVDPSIFGTLLEQALDPVERRKLGAHYTPRAYVERLVIATVIEPLRVEWGNVQVAAEARRAAGDRHGAAALVQAFHDSLCQTRVLDPACGTGNFLYVSLELMKRLEGEVLEALNDLGGQEGLRGLGSHSIDPHQFLGLEINPRAAAIAELVLWIGYLQWHFRTQGGPPDEPILRAFKNIVVTDAVLTWDGAPEVKAAGGRKAYPNARRPEWPQAHFIVGNPPFIGNKRMGAIYSEEYLAALRAQHSMLDAVDLVMIWWMIAADIASAKESVLKRFGFVTTNSISQTFNRRVVEHFTGEKGKLYIRHCFPDHPWTKATKDTAAVRIAMTVVEKGSDEGELHEVVSERGLDEENPEILFSRKRGIINSDLSIGPNVANAGSLRANEGLSHQGVILVGEGFRLSHKDLAQLGLNPEKLPAEIKRYLIGRDLVQRSEERFVIDLYGYSAEQARRQLPKIFQIVLERVKPQRDQVNRKRTREQFWIYAEPRKTMRDALKGMSRYIATCRTAKHRIFVFVDSKILPDAKVIAIALEDGYTLGVLSSRVHLLWSQKSGAWLGVGNDSNYNHSECFAKFPFPDASGLDRHRIRTIAEELDAHRKRVLAEHSHLTLTGLYNVLEDLRGGTAPDALDPKARRIFDDGLVLIMKELHDRLDEAVAQAYGWPADLANDDILARLVTLNKARAAGERRGEVRWLRPDYQAARFGKGADQQAAKEEGTQMAVPLNAERAQKPSFPAGAVDQVAAVFDVLLDASGPLAAPEIAARFRRTRTTEAVIQGILASFARVGRANTDGRAFVAGRPT